MEKAWYINNSFGESTELKNNKEKKKTLQKGEVDNVELYHFFSVLCFWVTLKYKPNSYGPI